jgi:electron transfer flavoprotein beta subunit
MPVRIVVPIKQVPDLVEELELSAAGTDIEREFLKFVVNEFDDYALEEAILIKEATGAEVVVVALDDPDVDQTLYTALAKGADRAVKLTGTGAAESWVDSHTRAAVLAAWLSGEAADLVLTGVQAADDLDGQLASLLGAQLGIPHVAVAVEVEAKDGTARIRQEFSGGTSADLEVRLPAVVGVQSARQAPRYVPITRIRQAMQAGGIDVVDVPAPSAASGLTIRRLFPPEATGHAEMLTGSADEIAARIVELVRAKGVLK